MTNSLPQLVAIGGAIKAAREQQGLTQAQLAERADTSRLSIIRIEQGTHMNTDTLVKVIDALGLKIQLLEKEK